MRREVAGAEAGQMPLATVDLPTAGALSAPALELRGVTKTFGSVRALTDVSFSIPPAQVLALAGENGAGKSTLASILAGLHTPDAGTLLVAGEEVRFAGPSDAHRAGIRIVPQELLLCPNLSVAENVGLGQLERSGLGVLRWKAVRDEARRRLDLLGVEAVDVGERVERLTVVEKTFVQIARALTPGARVLIVDEPTAPMGGTDVERLLSVLGAVIDQGIAIVYISHRLDEVFRIAHGAVVLRDGRKVAEYDAANLDRTALVEAIVGGRDLAVADRRSKAAATAGVAMHVDHLRAGDTIADVSFELRTGEVLVAYGIAGSGREQLGGAVVGALSRSAGEVTVNGRAIPPGNVRATIRAGVGYVPAERRSQGLVMEASVRENMSLAMLPRLVRRGVLRKGPERATVDRWITRLNIATPSGETPVGRLSGGSQQKVLLARWLAAGAKSLVLEEPTRGVDIATKAEIYRLLRQLADDGAAVLVVTSDIEEAALLGDRTLVLRDGVIATTLTGATQDQLAQAALTTKESA